MSHITDVILITGLDDGNTSDDDLHPNLDKVNAWLTEKGYAPLSLISEGPGVNKYPISDIAVGAFNYLSHLEFRNFVFSVEWEDPEQVQLLIHDEYELIYTLYTAVHQVYACGNTVNVSPRSTEEE